MIEESVNSMIDEQKTTQPEEQKEKNITKLQGLLGQYYKS